MNQQSIGRKPVSIFTGIIRSRRSRMGKKISFICIILVSLAIIAGFSSCGREKTQVPEEKVVPAEPAVETEPVVYISGWYVSSTNIPGYWKDGAFTELEPAGARATGVYVSGEDVYVSGDKSGATIYWKNGEKTDLTSSDTFGDGATGIAAVGSDVYVIGKSKGNMTIWKNSEADHVGDGQFAFIYDIVVAEGAVYAVGNTGDELAYWKNGEKTKIADSFAGGKGLFVSGGTVYVAGEVSQGVCYWKDGQQVMLTEPEDGYSLPEGIAVYAEGDDVYVAGVVTEDEVRKGCLWKNGELRFLETGDVMLSYVSDMTMAGEELYITGAYVQDGKTYAALWKEGEITTLQIDADQAYASGIMIRY
jgi:hypothetical protein